MSDETAGAGDKSHTRGFMHHSTCFTFSHLPCGLIVLRAVDSETAKHKQSNNWKYLWLKHKRDKKVVVF
jgi:hypothetical protein